MTRKPVRQSTTLYIGSLLLLMTVFTTTTALSCKRRDFILLSPSDSSPGNVLETFPSTTLKLCQRACRLYYHCTAFLYSATEDCTLLRSVDDKGYSPPAPECLYSFCPNQMTFYPEVGQCYHPVRNPRETWDEAATYCEALYPGTHVIDINTEAENILLLKIAAIADIEVVWTSGRSVSPNGGKYKWRNSKKAFDYTNWYPAEPSSPSDDCVEMATDGTWADSKCDEKLSFICEF